MRRARRRRRARDGPRPRSRRRRRGRRCDHAQVGAGPQRRREALHHQRVAEAQPSLKHGSRGWHTSSSALPTSQRSPITAPVTSMPSTVRFSPNMPAAAGGRAPPPTSGCPRRRRRRPPCRGRRGRAGRPARRPPGQRPDRHRTRDGRLRDPAHDRPPAPDRELRRARGADRENAPDKNVKRCCPRAGGRDRRGQGSAQQVSPPAVTIGKPARRTRPRPRPRGSAAPRRCPRRRRRRAPPTAARTSGCSSRPRTSRPSESEVGRADVDAAGRGGRDLLDRLQPGARLAHHEAERLLRRPAAGGPRSAAPRARSASPRHRRRASSDAVDQRHDDARRTEVERVADHPRVVAPTRTSGERAARRDRREHARHRRRVDRAVLLVDDHVVGARARGELGGQRAPGSWPRARSAAPPGRRTSRALTAAAPASSSCRSGMPSRPVAGIVGLQRRGAPRPPRRAYSAHEVEPGDAGRRAARGVLSFVVMQPERAGSRRGRAAPVTAPTSARAMPTPSTRAHHASSSSPAALLARMA